MKIGMRTPSPKRSIKARTTGKINRIAKSSVNPLYEKKGMGYINNPQKAIYNKVYNKTTVGVRQVFDNPSSAEVVEQNNISKKICPNCNGIFINNTICPNCGCQLNDINDEQSSGDTSQTDYDKAAGCAAVIYMCFKMAFVIIVGIFTFIMKLYFISFLAFLIVAIACYFAYKMTSS